MKTLSLLFLIANIANASIHCDSIERTGASLDITLTKNLSDEWKETAEVKSSFSGDKLNYCNTLTNDAVRIEIECANMVEGYPRTVILVTKKSGASYLMNEASDKTNSSVEFFSCKLD